MRNPLRTWARALLLLLAATSHGATAFQDYQMMVYFENAPFGADLAALAAAKSLFASVVQWLLTCEILGPGQAPANRNRALLDGAAAAAADSASEVESDFSQGALRGAATAELEDRELWMSSCPNACSNSGTTKCKSLGCAFCGRCRRRDLQTASTTTNATEFSLSRSNALKIEGTMNAGLKVFCLFRSKCKIYVKVYRLLPDGTAYPLTG
jgi:hypothetical protein